MAVVLGYVDAAADLPGRYQFLKGADNRGNHSAGDAVAVRQEGIFLKAVAVVEKIRCPAEDDLFRDSVDIVTHVIVNQIVYFFQFIVGIAG